MNNPGVETVLAQKSNEIWKQLVPTRALLLLLGIGFLDLVSTAVLHAQGKIVELNPIMRPIIEHSEWLFAFVKGMSILLAWAVMAHYAQTNRDFVRKTALIGSGAYATIWLVWFIAGSLSM